MQKNRLSAWLYLLLATVTLLSAAEFGTVYPDGWHFTGGKGEITPEGVLRVTGNGDSCTYWLSAPCDFQGGHSYMISYEGRSPDKAGGTFITGPSHCNVDHYNFGPEWQTTQDILVYPDNGHPAPVRMGEWHLRGTAEYRNIRVTEVFPIYSHMGDFTLGSGEVMKTNEYTFTPMLNSAGHMEARPLESFTCDFNTDRFVFGDDQEVVYHFQINTKNFQSGHLEIGIRHYVGGILTVELSKDRQQWVELTKLNSLDAVDVPFPQELFPAKELYLRLKASSSRKTDSVNSDPGSLQVGNLKFYASLDGGPVEMTGATQYAAILHGDSRLAVEILDLGEVIPDGENFLRLAIRNLSGRKIRLAPQTILSKTTGTAAAEQNRGEKLTLAPGEAREIAIPYSLSDTGDWLLTARLGGDSPYQLQCRLSVSSYFNTSYGEILSEDDTAVVWSAAPEWKVPRKRKSPTARGTALQIAGARGESEDMQLILRPARPVKDVSLTVSELRCGDAVIPADAIDLLRVHYLDIQRKTDSSGVLGFWPDPLPPLKPGLSLEAETNQPVFVRANIPDDAKPGLYRGVITVSGDASWRAEIPLEVRVFDFALPKEMTCQTAFGYNAALTWKYHKANTPEEQRSVHAEYMQLLSEHHISPYNPTPLAGIGIRLQKPEGGETHRPEELALTLDWTEWDRDMEEALAKYHFNTFQLYVHGLGGGTFHSRQVPEFLGYKEDSPEYQYLYPIYLGLLQEHLEKKGWLDKAFVYWFDEPETKDYPYVMNGFRKLKEGAPKIRRMLTEPIGEDLFGGPNLWCPVSYEHSDTDWDRRRPLGEQSWWYICTGPKAPYAALFIDHPGIELRLWLWQTWQHNIQGILIWTSNLWTSPCAYPDSLQNPYLDPMSWVVGYDTPKGAKIPWGNGDGRFVYPPESAQDGNQPGFVADKPVSSIRLEMLRDGIEDYEYFVILKRLLAEKRGTLSPEEEQAYAALLAVPAEITTSMTEFAVDSTALKLHRLKLAEAIEELQKK